MHSFIFYLQLREGISHLVVLDLNREVKSMDLGLVRRPREEQRDCQEGRLPWKFPDIVPPQIKFLNTYKVKYELGLPLWGVILLPSCNF